MQNKRQMFSFPLSCSLNSQNAFQFRALHPVTFINTATPSLSPRHLPVDVSVELWLVAGSKWFCNWMLREERACVRLHTRETNERGLSADSCALSQLKSCQTSSTDMSRRAKIEEVGVVRVRWGKDRGDRTRAESWQARRGKQKNPKNSHERQWRGRWIIWQHNQVWQRYWMMWHVPASESDWWSIGHHND